MIIKILEYKIKISIQYTVTTMLYAVMFSIIAFGVIMVSIMMASVGKWPLLVILTPNILYPASMFLSSLYSAFNFSEQSILEPTLGNVLYFLIFTLNGFSVNDLLWVGGFNWRGMLGEHILISEAFVLCSVVSVLGAICGVLLKRLITKIKQISIENE